MSAPVLLEQTHLFRQPQLIPGVEGEDPRQTWRTPPLLFKGLQERYGFRLDAAADATNHLCDHWLGVADDAPECRWRLDGRPVPTWWNPPFKQCDRWARAAIRERATGTLSCGLVVGNPNSVWLTDLALPHCTHWTFRGRVHYVAPPWLKHKDRPDRDSLFLVFDPQTPGDRFGGVLCPRTGAILRKAA